MLLLRQDIAYFDRSCTHTLSKWWCVLSKNNEKVKFDNYFIIHVVGAQPMIEHVDSHINQIIFLKAMLRLIFPVSMPPLKLSYSMGDT